MSLHSFVKDTGQPEASITIIGGEETGPLEQMLADVFENQTVTVGTTDAREHLDDKVEQVEDEREQMADDSERVVLLSEDGTLATSTMGELYDALLAINSDLFVTGARPVGEVELPDVIAHLDDSRFRLRGYPLAHKEKLLLIVVSRYIEQLAWQREAGTLRSSFQRLSRIDDEIGTKSVYESISGTPVEVHMYGIDDGYTFEMAAQVHTGTSAEFRQSWFVVYRPEDPAEQHGALVCYEIEPRVWDGFWTFDANRTRQIESYIATNL